MDTGPRRARVAAGLVGFAVSRLLTACCDEPDCTSSLTVEIVEPDGGPIEPGNYAFEIVVDGEVDQFPCEVTADSDHVSCRGSSAALEGYSILSGVPGGEWTVRVLGFRSREEPLPNTVEIRVAHEGDPILNATLDPVYRSNGMDCDGECLVSEIELSFVR